MLEEFRQHITQRVLAVGGELQNADRLTADLACDVISDLEEIIADINDCEWIDWDEGL